MQSPSSSMFSIWPIKYRDNVNLGVYLKAIIVTHLSFLFLVTWVWAAGSQWSPPPPGSWPGWWSPQWPGPRTGWCAPPSGCTHPAAAGSRTPLSDCSWPPSPDPCTSWGNTWHLTMLWLWPDGDGDPGQDVPLGVHGQAPHPSVHWAQQRQQGGVVVIPVCHQALTVWPLVTRHLGRRIKDIR